MREKDGFIEEIQVLNSEKESWVRAANEKFAQSGLMMELEKYKGKAKRYKDRIKLLKKDVRALQRSNNVSKKALKHTEHFVEEVVNVNEQLVQTLTSNQKIFQLLDNNKRRSKSAG